MAMTARQRRLLVEIEAALTADDPRLAARLTTMRVRPAGVVVLGAAVLLTGLVALAAGVAAEQVALMTVGLFLAICGPLLTVLAARALRSARRRCW